MSPIQKEQILKSWIANDQIVHLTRAKGTLSFNVVDITTRKTSPYSCPIPIAFTIDGMISHLLSCEVIVRKNEVPCFIKPSHQWKVGEKEINLFYHKTIKSLICQIFNTTTGERFECDALECMLPSKRCHEETVKVIEAVKTKPIADVISFLKGFHVSLVIDESFSKQALDVEYVHKRVAAEKFQESTDRSALKSVGLAAASGIGAVTSPGICAAAAPGICAVAASMAFPLCIAGLAYASKDMLGNIYKTLYNIRNIQCNEQSLLKRNSDRIKALEVSPLLIEIEPINFPSQIDERVRVSSFRWAVTLIARKGPCGNHAEICFEGVENNKYFCTVGHFTGLQVKIEDFEGDKKFASRSKIWMRPKEKVKEIIALIQKEMEENIEFPFAILGKKSFIHIYGDWRGGDMNCLDWAREKLLLMDIELEENPTKKAIKDKVESIVAATRFYTHAPDDYLSELVNVLI